VSYRTVEVGSIVRFLEDANRNEDGQSEIIPAIVMNQWPDGSLQLFCFNFAQQYLKNSVPLDRVEILFDPQQMRTVIAASTPEAKRESRLTAALTSARS
jgi:hypothetical protein